MSDQLIIFACDDECAARVFEDNNPGDMFDGYLSIRRADDLEGLELETLEVARCYHRWTAGVLTAWKHLEWCVFMFLEPVEVRWDKNGRK